MGVSVYANLMYGWKVMRDKIPDHDLHEENEWRDVLCKDESSYKAFLGGSETRYDSYELVDNPDSYAETGIRYVGIPLAADCTAAELMSKIEAADKVVDELFEKVMGRRCDPDNEPPKVWLYEEWC